MRSLWTYKRSTIECLSDIRPRHKIIGNERHLTRFINKHYVRWMFAYYLFRAPTPIVVRRLTGTQEADICRDAGMKDNGLHFRGGTNKKSYCALEVIHSDVKNMFFVVWLQSYEICLVSIHGRHGRYIFCKQSISDKINLLHICQSLKFLIIHLRQVVYKIHTYMKKHSFLVPSATNTKFIQEAPFEFSRKSGTRRFRY